MKRPNSKNKSGQVTNSRKKTGKRRGGFRFLAFLFLLLIAYVLIIYFHLFGQPVEPGSTEEAALTADGFSRSIAEFDPSRIPDYSGEDYVTLNDNIPMFTEKDLNEISGEHYAEPDRLGRCGTAYAMLDRSMMSSSNREEINRIRPSGWQYMEYPDLIPEGYLYNRSHLIAYRLTGQNANARNLITGTQYMNQVSMLQFELRVMDYLESAWGRHVLYRVSPYFKDRELVARGVEMEAYSVEDRGRSICFHVFVYNYQPGVEIDYMTGHSRRKV